ncbi:MAG TPA: 4-hydroxythreonine-4-phosphate dehydrogenase PdxA [Candidatus Margulisiibacteriota bacterium]|nr:4-hydroxythreonine-4-phosphate dehydrogenase PdxA [Candidatus Margulisiibacteriota bacterium]
MSLRRNPISKSPKIKIGITIGDPSGIGPALVLKSIAGFKGKAEFILIGDRGVLSRAVKARMPPNLVLMDLKNIRLRNFSFGHIRPEYGRASIEYLDKAMELLSRGRIDCLVTAPISKEAISLAGLPYTGHTEYFAEKTGVKNTEMMLLNRYLKTILLTRHIPLKDVSRRITRERIKEVVLSAHSSLKRLFLIKEPRIVVCGLNPHASDGGIIGGEEKEVFIPAIKELKSRVRYIEGPLPADTAILKVKNKLFDCAVTVYHDQSLIALKALGSSSGVNLTLGLPFIRTSPLHGTAFDIAYKTGLIDPASMIESIKLAIRCTLNLRKD